MRDSRIGSDGPPKEARVQYWRERAERAEARVADLEGQLADALHNEQWAYGVTKRHRADRDAALDLLRRWKVVGDVLFYIAPAPVVRDTDAFLARVDSGAPPAAREERRAIYERGAKAHALERTQGRSSEPDGYDRLAAAAVLDASGLLARVDSGTEPK